MAYFETVESVDDFTQEFNGYLAPGIMKDPDLAVEVARLEGLPVEWKTLEEDDRKSFQESHVVLTYEAADRQVYNPDAERETRLAAEGHTYESTQPMIECQMYQEDVTLDFDL